MLDTERYTVASVRDAGDGLSVRGWRILPTVGESETELALYDGRPGEGGCRLVLNGAAADRRGVFAWLGTVLDPEVEVDRDYLGRFGHITEARFSG